MTGGQNTVGAGTDTLSGIENLTGSHYNDTLSGDSNDNVITGGVQHRVYEVRLSAATAHCNKSLERPGLP